MYGPPPTIVPALPPSPPPNLPSTLMRATNCDGGKEWEDGETRETREPHVRLENLQWDGGSDEELSLQSLSSSRGNQVSMVIFTAHPPPPQDTWQGLKTFGVVPTGGWGATGIKDAAQHPSNLGAFPQQSSRASSG